MIIRHNDESYYDIQNSTLVPWNKDDINAYMVHDMRLVQVSKQMLNMVCGTVPFLVITILQRQASIRVDWSV